MQDFRDRPSFLEHQPTRETWWRKYRADIAVIACILAGTFLLCLWIASVNVQ